MRFIYNICTILLFVASHSFAQTDTIKIAKSEPVIMSIVDEQPEFKGDSLSSFITHMVRYPQTALTQNIFGTVYLSFVIHENGSISDIKVLKGAGVDLDNEAIRVIKLTNNHWWPGKQNGKIVKTRFIVPIKFRLD